MSSGLDVEPEVGFCESQKQTRNKQKIMKNYKTIIALVAVGLVCSAATSKAVLYGVVLNNNSVFANVPNNPVSTSGLGSPLVSTFANTSGSTTQAGVLDSWVSSVMSNPYGAGDLTFIYKLTETGNADIATLALNGFSSLTQVTVNNLSLTGGAAALQANLTAGGTLNFTFSGITGNGNFSDELVVYTSSKVWGQATANVIDNVTAGAADLAPVAPVPEPTTAVAGALLLLPFGASTLRILRKNRTA
jgi:hypothetical protein